MIFEHEALRRALAAIDLVASHSVGAEVLFDQVKKAITDEFTIPAIWQVEAYSDVDRWFLRNRETGEEYKVKARGDGLRRLCFRSEEAAIQHAHALNSALKVRA